ncbi:MAG TPA: anti-sigma-D factor RsdA [Pseudonocardia sp.]|nr:anti-sigma-D factor RsdA [Pseudonocardia sp.]
MRSGDIGDEVARSAEDADLPLDLAAVRADDDLIEALSAGLVPPPSGPRDPSDVEGELVALLAGWVADVRPESLLHPPGSQPATVRVMADAEPTDEDEPLAAVGSPAPVRSLLEFEDAEPVAITRGRSSGARAYLLRAAAGLAAVALIGSGLVVRSYDAHPGDSLWLVAKVVFPEKSRSVEAATVVSTALNTARVALESGRIDEARAAFQTVQDQLAAVDDADGRAELAHQRDYLTTQLSGSPHIIAQQVVATTAGPPPLATGQAGATIPSSPTVTPGATQALLTPTASPSVLAAPPADPAATAPGAGGSSAAAGGSSAPAVVAAPAPDAAVSAPPAVGEAAPSDAASGSSSAGSAPPAAVPPQAADPATNPPVATPSPEPPAPTSAPADPATTVQSTPDPPVDNGGSGGGTDTTQSAADNSPAVAPSEQSDSSGGSGGDAAAKSSDSSGGGSDGGQESTKSSDGGSGETAAASAEISVDGLAGSTLGAVTGVVASTTGTS